MIPTISDRRLANQHITTTGLRRPEDVVSWLGAVQAQEYDPAKWALGLRMRDGAGEADIERAVNAGAILRTHVMRPTWHFVTPQDIRWLLELTAARVHRVMAPYNRHLELDARTLARGTDFIARALNEEGNLTRPELSVRLDRAGLPMVGPRLAHLTMYAELEGVICSGPRSGKRFTYALLADRAPKAAPLSRDEALATLARRFFSSHGPATVRDFVWWSGVPTADARRALDIIKARRHDVEGLAYWTVGSMPRTVKLTPRAQLLPIYDEYLIAYRDRVAVPHGPTTTTWGSTRPLSFQHPLIIAGQVTGTWRTTRRTSEVVVDVLLLRRLTSGERRALDESRRRYEKFVAVPVKLSISH